VEEVNVIPVTEAHKKRSEYLWHRHERRTAVADSGESYGKVYKAIAAKINKLHGKIRTLAVVVENEDVDGIDAELYNSRPDAAATAESEEETAPEEAVTNFN